MKMPMALLFLAFAALGSSPAAASECKLEEGYTFEQGRWLLLNRTASCIISESVILGQYCEDMEEHGFCDQISSTRLVQILHPEHGYLSCSIEVGPAATGGHVFGQAIACDRYGFVKHSYVP